MKKLLSALLLLALLMLLPACGSRDTVGGMQLTVLQAERGVQSDHYFGQRDCFPVMLQITNVSGKAIGPLSEVFSAELHMAGRVFTSDVVFTRTAGDNDEALPDGCLLSPGETVCVRLRFFPSVEDARRMDADMRIAIGDDSITIPFPHMDE